MNEYLLAPFHPVRKTNIPPNDLKTSRHNIPPLMFKPLKGIDVHAKRLIKKKKIGDKDNKIEFPPHELFSLIKSFIPSLKGWKTPNIPTKFGPFRD